MLITDINPDGDSNEDALICHSEIDTFTSTYGNWYLATEISTDTGDRIVDPDPRGWLRNRGLKSGHARTREIRTRYRYACGTDTHAVQRRSYQLLGNSEHTG